MVNKKCPNCDTELRAELDPDYAFAGVFSSITTLPTISGIVLGNSKNLIFPGIMCFLLIGLAFFVSVEKRTKQRCKITRSPVLKRVVPYFIGINIFLLILAYIYKYAWVECWGCFS